MKIKIALSLVLLGMMAFSLVHALQVVYVGEIDLLVYCEEGKMQVTHYEEHDYIQVHCEPPTAPPADADHFIYVPLVQK